GCCLIFFEEATQVGLQTVSEPRQVKRPEGRAPKESRRVAELERALAENRDYTQSLQEQHEAANEELQASNEEVTSANEELQSINEELETSKEELESTNEELTTVNDEMANRNAELNRTNADLNNLHTGINMAIVLLTRGEREIAAARDYAQAILRTTRYPLLVLTAELRVHAANAAFYQTFKVPPGETNGRLIYELGNGQWNIPKLRELLEDILPRNS